MNRNPVPHRFLTLIALAVLALALVACGGDDNGDEEPTPVGTPPAGPDGTVPTATPLAQVPEPTIVTGDGTGTGTPGGDSDARYTVEAGDSLSAIASRFGVPVDEIRAANNLDGDNIFVGQELIIPRSGGAPPAGTPAPGTPATPTPAPGGGDVHVVESGDTPSGIAAQYGVTLAELEAANGGPFGVLQIGQEIIIP